MRFTVSFEDLATSASADTFITLAALICADTAGLRARLRKLTISFADDTPQNANAAFQIKRIADVSAGTAGTAGTTIGTSSVPKVDDQSADSPASAKLAYSAEPTTYETYPLWRGEGNALGGVIREWGERDAPTIQRDQHLGLLAAPRAASALRISGTLEFEQF